MRMLKPEFIATVVIALLMTSAAHAQTGSGARVGGARTGPSATPATTTPSTSTASGTSVSGTSSGDAFTGSSRGDAPTLLAPSSNPAGVVDRDGRFLNPNTSGQRPGTEVVNEGISADTGPTLRGLESSTGATSVTNSTGTSSNSGSGNNANTTGNGATADGGRAGSVTSTPELDMAARREAQRARKTVERKGQMMQSIAPRSNVDRTDQMPDDATPLLSPNRR